MTRVLTLCAVSLGMVACASSPPESSAPAAQASSPAYSSASTAASTSTVASTPAVASGTASSATAQSSDGELHVVAVPTVAKTSAPPAPAADEPHGDELICRREKTTGSHRVTRICRTRTQVEREREASQTMVRDAMRAPDGQKGR